MVRIPRTPKRTPEEPIPEIPLQEVQGAFDPPTIELTSAKADAPTLQPFPLIRRRAPLPKAPREKGIPTTRAPDKTRTTSRPPPKRQG